MEDILLILLLALAFFVVFYACQPAEQQNEQMMTEIEIREEKTDTLFTMNSGNNQREQNATQDTKPYSSAIFAYCLAVSP